MDVVLAAKEAFHRLVFAQEKVRISEEALAAAERTAVDARLDALERIEAEGLLANARRQASEATRDLALARLNFLRVLNLETDVDFRVFSDVKTHVVEVDTSKAALWAMELRPELNAETYRAQMDAIAVNLAMGRRYPTIFAAGDYEVTAQRFPLKNNNWDISIGIKIPLAYDFLTKLRQRRAEQRQGQLKRAALQDQVRLEVRQAVEGFSYWKSEIILREPSYRKVARLYDSLPERVGGLARLKAWLSVTDLRLSYLSASAEYALARAKLERAVGRDLTP
jgi:outer membrane protein TolC